MPGRISTRDESDPQLVADKVLPLTEQGLETLRTPPRRDPPPRPEPPKRHRLWVRLPDKDHPAVKRIELILEMFPGDEQLVLVFEDTGRRAAARCVVHPALVEELRELAGSGQRRRHGGEKPLTRRAFYGIMNVNLSPDRIGTGRGRHSGV